MLTKLYSILLYECSIKSLLSVSEDRVVLVLSSVNHLCSVVLIGKLVECIGNYLSAVLASYVMSKIISVF